METRREPVKSKRYDNTIFATGPELKSPSPVKAKRTKVEIAPDKQMYTGYTVSVMASVALFDGIY